MLYYKTTTHRDRVILMPLCHANDPVWFKKGTSAPLTSRDVLPDRLKQVRDVTYYVRKRSQGCVASGDVTGKGPSRWQVLLFKVRLRGKSSPCYLAACYSLVEFL